MKEWFPLILSTVLLLIFCCIAVIMLIFPKKVLRFFAEYTRFFGADGDMPMLPGTKLLTGGRTWSEYIRTMREQPEELRYLLLWSRVFGFFVLVMIFLTVCGLLYLINIGLIEI